jgi:hypothetical protein
MSSQDIRVGVVCASALLRYADVAVAAHPQSDPHTKPYNVHQFMEDLLLNQSFICARNIGRDAGFGP